MKSTKEFGNLLAGACMRNTWRGQNMNLDEALFYTSDSNGKRSWCYTNDRNELEKFVIEKHEKLSEKFMVVGALSGRGPLLLIQVPPKVKINAEYNVEHVLKPLLEE